MVAFAVGIIGPVLCSKVCDRLDMREFMLLMSACVSRLCCDALCDCVALLFGCGWVVHDSMSCLAWMIDVLPRQSLSVDVGFFAM